MTSTNERLNQNPADSGTVQSRSTSPANDSAGRSRPPFTPLYNDTSKVRRQVDILQRRPGGFNREYYDILRWMVDSISTIETQIDEQNIAIARLRFNLTNYEASLEKLQYEVDHLSQSLDDAETKIRTQTESSQKVAFEIGSSTVMTLISLYGIWYGVSTNILPITFLGIVLLSIVMYYLWSLKNRRTEQ